MHKPILIELGLKAGCCTLASVGLLLASQAALASAFQLHENSVQALGRAYAGRTTVGDDCSVVANNPAAMGLLSSDCFQADVTAIKFSAQFNGKATSALGAPISGGNGGDAGMTLPVPALYWATAVSSKVHLGVGFTVPFGFTTEYNSDWKGRYNAIKSKFQSLDGTVSVSWDVSERMSLGLSAIAQRTSAELTSAINYQMVAVGGINKAAQALSWTPVKTQTALGYTTTAVPAGSDGIAKVKGDDWGYGWQIGALWRLTDHDRLALKYRAKIKHTITGDATFTVSPKFASFVTTSPYSAIFASSVNMFQDTKGRANFTTPAVISASYWHDAGAFGVGATLAYTQWDVFKNLTVRYDNPAQPDTVEPFDWGNTIYVAVGADWYVSNALTLRAGVAYDQTPTKDTTRDPRVPDGDRQMVALGLGYSMTDNWTLNASYSHVFVSSAAVNTTSSTSDNLVGSFDDSGDLLGISLQYQY